MAVDNVELHPEALEEALAAYAYYLENSIRAADRFFAELGRAFDRILEVPASWPPYLHRTRHFILTDYPYSVVYKESGKQVIVYAVAHGKRKPGYWRKRLGWNPPFA